VLESIRVLERALDAKAELRFEPRAPGDPLRTRADSTLIERDLLFKPSTPIERGLEAEAEWARALYVGAER
jgi:UDP-glucuronate 4-epimerase